MAEKKDIYELAQASSRREAKRIYDVPLADLSQERWKVARRRSRSLIVPPALSCYDLDTSHAEQLKYEWRNYAN